MPSGKRINDDELLVLTIFGIICFLGGIWVWRKRAELKWQTYELERKLEKYIESEVTERVKTVSKRSKEHTDPPEYK